MHPTYDLIESFTGLFIFEVSGRDYCLNDAIVISTVRPPFDIPRCHRQDKSDNHQIRVNNKSIPLINLKKILNPEGAGEVTDRDSRVIIIENNDEQFGILVDKIIEIIALDAKYVMTSVKFNTETDMPAGCEGHKYLECSLEIDGRCILLLNINPLLNSITLSKN